MGEDGRIKTPHSTLILSFACSFSGNEEVGMDRFISLPPHPRHTSRVEEVFQKRVISLKEKRRWYVTF